MSGQGVERRTLAEHIRERLHILADQQRLAMHRHPDRYPPAALADRADAWLADARERLVLGVEVDRRRGRVDHRSLSVTALLPLHAPAGARPEDVQVVRLGRWRVRDLVDFDGQRIDTAQSVRDLLAQHAPVPDDLSGLDTP